MRWLQNISFSSPSTSLPSSSASSPKPDDVQHHHQQQHQHQHQHHHGYRGSGGAGGLQIGPRLTRQRKLRHLSDNEIAGARKSSPDASDAVFLSPSPNGFDNFSSSSRSSSFAAAVPLPLPPPVSEGDGELRLPSPKEAAHGKAVEERDRDRDRMDGAGEGVSPSTAFGSVFTGRDARKRTEPLDARSSRMVRQDLNSADSSRYNFRLNVPTRSAPTSPLMSPVLSPQRPSMADLFPYHHMVPKGNQVWSAPEMATLDIPGLPPPAFFDYTAFSTDSSPLHSPPNRSPRRNPRSPSGPASPLHSKLSIETSTTRRESNGHINVHPLPLPPGAAMPSPSASITQVTARQESLPMNCQWQKGKLIGRGTFGSVYVASNRETGALCAMKEVELFPDDPKSAECIRQLEQEIKVLSQFKHPNIVQYYGSEIVDDRFYIYLEYVHPGSINRYAREHCGAITESVVRNFTRHILSGLQYLHSTKTIHRDIKGANLLVDASGVVKLADFGMAKHLTGQAADLSLKGSPYWMAPELMQAVMQKDSNSDLALAVDIWSLGCTIIEMLTGKPPWSEYEGAAAMFKVMRDTPPVPETLSSEGKDFLRCCFQRNPAERPTASMLLEHRFLKNSQHFDGPSYTQSSNGMKMMDIPHSPRERSEIKLDQLPIFPSSQSTKKMTSDSETGQRSLPEASDLTVDFRYSPRSTLEPLPSLSPPRSGHSTHHRSSSAKVLSSISRGAKKIHIFR